MSLATLDREPYQDSIRTAYSSLYLPHTSWQAPAHSQQETGPILEFNTNTVMCDFKELKNCTIVQDKVPPGSQDCNPLSKGRLKVRYKKVSFSCSELLCFTIKYTFSQDWMVYWKQINSHYNSHVLHILQVTQLCKWEQLNGNVWQEKLPMF